MLLLGIKKKLELMTNISVIVLAALFLLVFISIELRRSLRARVELGLISGRMIDQPELTADAVTDQILLIAMTTDCEPCVESVPFYREIAKRSVVSGRIDVIAVFPTGTGQLTEFLNSHQLPLETVKRANFDEIRLSTTPTLILLDRSGKIVDFWIGKLSEEDEQHVLNRL